MPRFHFHLADGRREPDTEGVELPDLRAARLSAVIHAGELLKHDPDVLWDKGQWRVEVTDERGVLLCTVITLAIDAPTPHQQEGRADAAEAAWPAPSFAAAVARPRADRR